MSTFEKPQQQTNYPERRIEEDLGGHLCGKVLSKWIKNMDGPMVTIIDVGCGDGRLTRAMSQAGDHIRNKDVQTIGYDPDKNSILKAKKRQKLSGSTSVASIIFTTELPEAANVIEVFSLSLHHFGEHDGKAGSIEDMKKEMRANINKMNPRYIAVIESDFQDANIEEFKDAFYNYKGVREIYQFAGRNISISEIEDFFDNEGTPKDQDEYDRALEKCFEFHKQFGKDDYVQLLEESGYQIEEVAWGQTEGLLKEQAKNRFIISAVQKDKKDKD